MIILSPIRINRLACFVGLMLFLLVGQSVQAKLPTILLTPGTSLERVEKQALYYLDDGDAKLTPEQALQKLAAGAFAAEQPTLARYRLKPTRIWIALRVQLDTAEGETTGRYLLGLGGKPFGPNQAYLMKDGQPSELIMTSSTKADSPWVEHNFNYRGTKSFDLQAGEAVTLLVNTDHNTRPAIGIFKEGELGRNQVIAAIIKVVMFMAILFLALTLILVSALSASRNGVMAGIAYLLILLQNVQAQIYPHYSSAYSSNDLIWHGVAATVILLQCYIFLYVFRDLFSGNRRFLCWAALIAVPATLIPMVLLRIYDGLWFGLFFSNCLIVIIIALRLEIRKSFRLTIAAWLVFCNIATFYLQQTAPLGLIANYYSDIFLFSSGLAIVALVIADIFRTRWEKDQLMQERIAGLELQTKTDRRLLRTEQNYSRARELAVRRKKQLTRASHDIRQPLSGLRLSLEQEEDSVSSELQSRLHEAIDYLEHLTDEFSDQDPQHAALSDNPETEKYALSIVLQGIKEMFAAESKAASIDFRVHISRCETAIPALALMRSLSNLVANSLRHAHASKILVGGRHLSKGHCVIEVRDNGRGMSAEELNTVQADGAKGAESTGSGLGLAIIHQLAERHDFAFTLDSTPGRGTCARLFLYGK